MESTPRAKIKNKGEISMVSPEFGKKPPAVTDKTQIYIVGGGIAGLSAAVFAIRDGHIPGKDIHIFEAYDHLGGSMHYAGSPDEPYYLHAAWKVNVEAHQCMWDLLSAIPSLTDPGKTVKDEVFEFNRTHKKDAKSRLIDKDKNRTDIPEYGPLGLSWRDRIDLIRLILIPESWHENRRIDSFFAPSFFATNFWKVFSSTFAIEYWNDLVEMKRYMRRFTHAVHTAGTGHAETVFPYTLYDSAIQPIAKWLGEHGVSFEMGCKVTDMDFKPSQDELTVEQIHYIRNGEKKKIVVNKGDNVFVTNGSMVADWRRGSMTEAPVLETGKLDGSWTLWENIVKKRSGLGNPSAFDSHVNESKWVTFCFTCKDPTFIKLYEQFTGNKPGQADMVTFKDSNWHMSILVPDQPFVMDQPEGTYCFGGCGLAPDVEGNYVKKKLSECNGEEILT